MVKSLLKNTENEHMKKYEYPLVSSPPSKRRKVIGKERQIHNKHQVKNPEELVFGEDYSKVRISEEGSHVISRLGKLESVWNDRESMQFSRNSHREEFMADCGITPYEGAGMWHLTHYLIPSEFEDTVPRQNSRE